MSSFFSTYLESNQSNVIKFPHLVDHSINLLSKIIYSRNHSSVVDKLSLTGSVKYSSTSFCCTGRIERIQFSISCSSRTIEFGPVSEGEDCTPIKPVSANNCE